MKIRTITGKFDKTCTTSNNLTENAIKDKVIRDFIEFAEPRMVSTMIVSGIKSEYELRDSQAGRTKIGEVDSGGMIGSNEYRYRVMGRIQRKSIIVEQIGTSGSDGTFTLKLRDNLLYPGMVARFYTGLHARAESEATGANGSYIQTFRTIDGSTFVFATHVAVQPGEYSCFGGYTTYGEGSLRGYSRSFFEDEYVGHLTIQRKTIGITGDALSDVTWYKVKEKGGWYWTKERQSKVQFMMEDEYAKWHAQSTMRDSLGNLLSQPTMNDFYTGNPIIAGDGVIEQIRGANDMTPTGADGNPTIDDFKEMMSALSKRSDMEYGNLWYVPTGTDGFNHVQDLLRDYLVNYYGGRKTYGGDEEIEVGELFTKYKFGGNTLNFVKMAMWDDQERFPGVGQDGKSAQGGSFIFLNNGLRGNGKRNVEILTKGANGVDRKMVTRYMNGLTGWMEKAATSSVDEMQFEMLKHDGIFVYNTQCCGLMEKQIAG